MRSAPAKPAAVATIYSRAQARGQDVLRASLLDVAVGLLDTEGFSALTMRRIAVEAGCSTTVLYRLFGAKDGIAGAVYREGFARLRHRLETVPRATGPDADPAAHLAAVGLAYREAALVERNFYVVMFNEAIPNYVPDDAARRAAAASLDVLRDAIRACAEAGILRADSDVDEVADVLWAASHGVISLELGGHFSAELGEQRFRALTASALSAYLAVG